MHPLAATTVIGATSESGNGLVVKLKKISFKSVRAELHTLEFPQDTFLNADKGVEPQDTAWVFLEFHVSNDTPLTPPSPKRRRKSWLNSVTVSFGFDLEVHLGQNAYPRIPEGYCMGVDGVIVYGVLQVFRQGLKLESHKRCKLA